MLPVSDFPGGQKIWIAPPGGNLGTLRHRPIWRRMETLADIGKLLRVCHLKQISSMQNFVTFDKIVLVFQNYACLMQSWKVGRVLSFSWIYFHMIYSYPMLNLTCWAELPWIAYLSCQGVLPYVQNTLSNPLSSWAVRWETDNTKQIDSFPLLS